MHFLLPAMLLPVGGWAKRDDIHDKSIAVQEKVILHCRA